MSIHKYHFGYNKELAAGFDRMKQPKKKLRKSKNSTNAPGRDLCQTPAYALGPIYALLDGYKPNPVIWESAAGEGNLVKALGERYTTVCTDIMALGDSGDFFSDDNIILQHDSWDIQVTNPPYSLKYKWLKRSYELGKPFALLMPVDTVGAKSAQSLFQRHGIYILFLDARVDFYMPNKGYQAGGAHFSTAWYTWGLHEPGVSWMNHIEKGVRNVSL